MTAKLPSFNSRQVISILKRRGFALDRNLYGVTAEEIALAEGQV